MEYPILCGNRKVDKIVREADDMVYFSYTFDSNNIGAQIFKKIENKKRRGKATIKYDYFLEKYTFKEFYACDWKKEEWKPASWISLEDGKELFHAPALNAIEKIPL